MISEPEIVGDFGSSPGTDVLTGSAAREPREPRPPRPWRWALGGVLMASVVWAGVLYAYRLQHDEQPDTRGYSMGLDLCQDVRLTALSGELGKRSDDSHWGSRNRALDLASCHVRLTPASDGSQRKRGTPRVSYEAEVTVSLHRKVDPAPEFEAQSRSREWFADAGPSKVEEVPGLGDEAYLATFDDGTDALPKLEVRDGSVELTLMLSVTYNYDQEDDPAKLAEPVAPDMEAFQPQMIADMRALMDRLKHRRTE
ncbi:hypothetical protein OG204_24485 [Streptomyces sp. NBC_01387]|uniref:hypothetical protein n=1 Tax=Streptomyces sp. NBC_01387 TaxID=2903849 RepID=UPI0032443456